MTNADDDLLDEEELAELAAAFGAPSDDEAPTEADELAFGREWDLKFGLLMKRCDELWRPSTKEH